MNILKNQVQNTLQLREDLVNPLESEEQLLALIEQLVQELIDTNFEKLLLLLYRIDINESKVKKAIDASGPEKASESIAKLILKREKQKIASREKYNTGNTDWEF